MNINSIIFMTNKSEMTFRYVNKISVCLSVVFGHTFSHTH